MPFDASPLAYRFTYRANKHAAGGDAAPLVAPVCLPRKWPLALFGEDYVESRIPTGRA